MHISKHSAESMLTSTGKTLAEIQNAIDKGTAASTFAIKDVKANVAVKKLSKPEPIAAQNVVGFLEGSDPQLKSEWVVVGAHYDHLGAFSGTGDTVYNGADDNASGTTGMLQLAKAFATLKQRPKRSMVFIGFSGEEKGLLGSRAMMRSGQLDSDKLVFMLNLDMIGRNADKPVAVLGNGFSTGITEAVEKSNQSAAVRIEFGGTDYSANSDHHPFFARGVPVLFFFTGTHTDYHQLGDHADKIAFARMTKIVRLAYGVLDQVASGTVTPNFIHHISWLGVAVQAKDLNGRAAAVVTSVEANSRGQRAGLAVGDIVRSIDGQVLTRPKKIGERFGALKPGKKAVVVLERAGSPVNVTVERAKRGYLGVMPSSLRAEERKKLGLLNNEGVKIRGTSPDGPAGKAGLKAGDVLIRINGHPLTWRTLGRHLARIGAGERVTLTVVRAGKRLKIPLTLAERPRRP